MKKNHLIILALAAVALSALAWFLAERERSSYAQAELGLFAPEFESRLAEVNGVTIQPAGKEAFSLQRDEAGQWVVPDKTSYAVDTTQLRKTLRALATAEVLEAKTANPDWHERLKLQDIDDAADTTVELVAKAGAEPVLAVLIGRTGQGGQYVRRVGDPQTWLIDQRLNPAQRAADWLDKALVDIKRADLRSLQVTPAEGEPWSLKRTGDNTTDFALLPAAPAERERNGANSNRILSALSSLRLLDVRGLDADDEAASWTQLRFHLYDGLIAEVKVREADGKHWLQLKASAGEIWQAPVAEGEEAPEPDTAALAERVAAINAKTTGRVFEVSSYPGVGLQLAYEKMLKDLPEEGDNAEG